MRQEEVTPTMHRPKHVPAQGAKRLADLAHALDERILRHEDLRPDSGQQLVFGDYFATVSRKVGQQCEGLGPQGHVRAIALQAAASAVEPQSGELEAARVLPFVHPWKLPMSVSRLTIPTRSSTDKTGDGPSVAAAVGRNDRRPAPDPRRLSGSIPCARPPVERSVDRDGDDGEPDQGGAEKPSRRGALAQDEEGGERAEEALGRDDDRRG